MKKVYVFGKEIHELSKEELIETLEFVIPQYLEQIKKISNLEKERFTLLVDKAKLLNC